MYIPRILTPHASNKGFNLDIQRLADLPRGIYYHPPNLDPSAIFIGSDFSTTSTSHNSSFYVPLHLVCSLRKSTHNGTPSESPPFSLAHAASPEIQTIHHHHNGNASTMPTPRRQHALLRALVRCEQQAQRLVLDDLHDER